MAFDTVVDKSRLDAAMTATADAIREKMGSSDPMIWDPDIGFQTAVNAIPSGGRPSDIAEKDVSFFDYDGTLLYSYTIPEAQALTELPPLPEHEGLVAQGWNWTLEQVNGIYRQTYIGANYDTDDGATKMHIDTVLDNLEVTLYLYQSAANDIRIDWGDGSAAETYGTSGKFSLSHTYAVGGRYVISLSSDSEAVQFGDYTQTICSPQVVRSVNIGSRVAVLNAYCLSAQDRLQTVSLPMSASFNGQQVFLNCNTLQFLALPKDARSFDTYFCRYNYALTGYSMPCGITMGKQPFDYCYALRAILIPEGTKEVWPYCFRYSSAANRVAVPPSVDTIGTYAFANCPNVLVYDFTRHTAVPTLVNTSAFSGINPVCRFLVPSSLYDAWTEAENWVTYANQMVGVNR